MSYQEPYDTEALVVYGRNNAKPAQPRYVPPEIRKVQPPAQELFRRPVYLCPELGRTSNRPNAYDAFDLPSLYGSRRKPYRFSEG